ncbi:ABC transporter substrate-binding protein [Baekduia alba]|uniref:ABC transporter substrate-binding protein n=1 Tax=Baekduia alba TaxID=2997333 RepID=UPI00234154E4|nr:ABC transporter substrate-binding protein [Baekduia alba]
MRSPRTRAGGLVAVAALALACAGCGGGGDAAGTGAAATPSQTDAKASACVPSGHGPATGKPIPVGAIVEKTGGPGVPQATAAAAAYYDCVNANGGIHGRPIKFLQFDSAYNPQKAGQGADHLIDDEGVVAFAGTSSFLDCLVNGSTYRSKGIYSLAGVAGPPECNNNTNIAAVDNGLADWVGAVQYAVEAQGAKRIALVVAKAGTIGDAIVAADTAYAKAHGAEIVKVDKIDNGLKDATSVVLDVASAHPDAVVVNTLQQDAIAILKAAQSQGLTQSPKWVCLSLCYSDNLPKVLGSGWKGLPIQTPFQPVDAQTPDNLLYRQVMAKYAPSAPLDPFSQGGFLAARIFTQALLGIDGPITRASAGKALKDVSGFRSDELCGPWHFGAGAITSQRVVKMTEDGFELASDCKPVPGAS